MNSNVFFRIAAVLAATLSVFVTTGFGERPPTAPSLFEMSLEELMEVPVVVSGSKREGSILESSIPITVVTAADIHYSGATTLIEALQFVPGVDIVQLDKHRYAIGIRGLHGYWSDRVKLLVDGRSADSIIYGGPELDSLTVHPDDIERIEIVRGPAGGAWGANAFTGIINVITKKAETVQGGLFSSSVNEFGDTCSFLRWGEKLGETHYRASVSYENMEDSAASLSDPVTYDSWAPPAYQALAGVSGYEPHDQGRSFRTELDFLHPLDESTHLQYGIGYRHNEFGATELMGYLSPNRSSEDYLNSFVQLEHTDENDNRLTAQYYNRFASAYIPNIENRAETLQHVLEMQYDFHWLDDHTTSLGIQAEYDTLNFTYRPTAAMNFHIADGSESTVGGYVIDTWHISPRLWTEQQIRVDEYSETGTDWAGRLAGFYALDDEHRHVFRVAAARAYRTPLAVLRETTGQTIPVGGGLYLMNIDRTPGLENESTYSLEAGYAGQWSEHVQFTTNAYLQHFDDLIGYITTTDGFGMSHITPYNLDGADTAGIETELAIQQDKQSMSLWYAYNDFDADSPGQSLRAYLPSKHKYGVTWRVFLADDWVFNVNYKQMRQTLFNDSSVAFDDLSRLDLALSKTFAKESCEIMVGVRDALDNCRMGATEINAISNHEVPGRTFFARLQMRF